ncbi:MAG TPA: SRPBCC family protein [Verrucomicrobiae bacterium]|nr:SRPBCC family protein [Verrucomicrobiae bacterium]
MILKIFVVIVALIAAVLIFAATRPNTFHVQRSMIIHAPADKIFALINNLPSWDSWEPDDRKDTTMKKTFSGPASGMGATAEWDSKGQGGKGRLSIIEAVPNSKVAVKVDFVKPFEAHNLNEFKLEPDSGGTKVTWSIEASNLYAMKLIGVFFNIPRQFGKHVKSGLSNLKSVAEK